MLPLLLTLTTAVSTLMGGWIAVRERRRVHVLLGFGAGVLLGASFFDLLPEALMAAARQGWSNRATLALPVLGFLLFYGADRFLETQDRKSTRLNSSHSSISYAVFCLKKKK